MTAVSVPNAEFLRKAPEPLRKEDGRPYRYELITADGERRYYADKIEDLITGIMDTTDDEEEMLERRIHHAHLVAGMKQPLALRTALLSGAELTDTERQILLGKAPIPEFWESACPLILVSTDFFPYTDTHAPLSNEGDIPDPYNIIWLRPETNEDYIRSLHTIGWATVNRHQAFQ